MTIRAILSLLIFAAAAFGQEKTPTGDYAVRLAQEQKAHPTLALGSDAPDFSLPGVDGKTHRLAEYTGHRVLVVMFTCNHCPMAQLYETRLKKLVDDYRSKDVAFVAIQPNDPKAIRLSELGFTDVSDGLDEMKVRAEYRHFNFPYLYDGDTQSAARAYGPKATPHLFIFDKDRKLQYEGRVDNSPRENLVKRKDASVAIEELLAGKNVEVPHTGAFWLFHQVEVEDRRPGAGGKSDRRAAGDGATGERRGTEDVADESDGEGAAGELLGDVVRTLCGRVPQAGRDLSDVPPPGLRHGDGVRELPG